jgi:arylsulfatase
VPIQGKSLIPLFKESVASVRSLQEHEGWELYQHRAIRQGDWKITWDANESDEATWMLFNLADDPAEQNDLSEANPQKLTEMIALWDRYVEENGVIY